MTTILWSIQYNPKSKRKSLFLLQTLTINFCNVWNIKYFNYHEHIISEEHNWKVKSGKNFKNYAAIDKLLFSISKDHFSEIERKVRLINEEKENVPNNKGWLIIRENSRITNKSWKTKDGEGISSIPTGSGNSGEVENLNQLNSRRILTKNNNLNSNSREDRLNYEEAKASSNINKFTIEDYNSKHLRSNDNNSSLYNGKLI